MPAARVCAFAVGALAAVLADRALHAAPPGGAERWSRTNHAGDPVTLLEGPSYAVGAAAGAAAGSGGIPAVLASLSAGAFGALDDLAGDSSSKGLRGHLSALRQGRVTTGAIKIAGLGLTGLVAAALCDRRGLPAPARAALGQPARGQPARGQPARGQPAHGQPAHGQPAHGQPALAHSSAAAVLGTLTGGAVIAGSANLANLLDLRPGRALKATVICAIPLAFGPRGSVTAAAAAGAATSCLPQDLAGRSMLGDTGANSAGALLGVALIERTGLRGRLVALAALTALTLASERFSFTTVIESTPGLRELDALGRRPRPLG